MITSISNAKIKNIVQLLVKAKARKEQNVYVVEGIRMFREAPKDQIVEIYMTEAVCRKENLNECFSWGIPVELVSEEVFRHMSATQTPQGILCVMRRPDHNFDETLSQGGGIWLLLEDIQDPGNLGTILRTGEGAGVRGVIMSKGTVDIYNPKTIRSTMGSIYRVPFWYVNDFDYTLEKLAESNIKTYAAHLDGKKYYDQFDFSKGCAFLIGNEGNGLKEETAKKANAYLKIPMEGSVESLNAAMACGILMYEAHRQIDTKRRQK